MFKVLKRDMQYRYSTITERKDFYEKEFSISKVKKWFKQNKIPLPQLCAIDAGSETGIILNKKNKDKMLYFEFKDLKKKIKKYVPEDIYYDRNRYKNPNKVLNSLNFSNPISQELVFDIDADNMHKKVNGKNLRKTYKIALNMKKDLLKTKQFKNIKIVYSGRGFHLHILDKEAYFLTIKEREFLNKKLSKYPIDPWVSRGFIRLIRMPYSLNSLVSRIVTPINAKKSFISSETIPKFILKKQFNLF